MQDTESRVFTGTIIWFNPKKGFGFIDWDKDGVKQKDLFVHFSDLSCNGYKTIDKNKTVSFKIGKNRNGDPKAVEVTW